MNIRPRLALLFAGVGVLAVAVTSGVNYIMAESALKVTVANQLVGLRSAKASHIETAFRDLRRTIEVKSADSATARAYLAFQAAFPKTSSVKLQDLYVKPIGGITDRSMIVDPGDSSPFTSVHKQFHPGLHDFRLSLGIVDVFLCEPKTGAILYTDRKGADFAANLGDPNLRDSGLTEVVLKCFRNNRTSISDLKPYAPSLNYPATFLACPIRNGHIVVGVFAAQIGFQQIDELATPGTTNREGLGESGETLIVGPDLALRNDSHGIAHMKDLKQDLKAQGLSGATLLEIEQTKMTALTIKVGPEYANALTADGYMETTNYRGKKVLAAYEPLSITGLRWGIVVEQDQAEAYEPLVSLRNTSLLAGCGMLLVTLLLAYLVSGSFTRPLAKLSEAARRFGGGELGVRAGLKGKDEYASLGRTFDQMVAQQERFDEAAASIRRNIVHDLKTPVAVVKGMAETLQQPGVAEEVALRTELIETIVQESERLLDDLQDILLPVTANYKPNLEGFDFSRLVMVTANLERHTSRAGRHKIEVTGANSPISILADRRKIRRALENLIGNAVKYSPGEGKEVHLSIEEDEEEVRLMIRDQGLGMTPEQLARVLGIGGRVEEHANMGIEGTGFGLSSVQQILLAHGGELLASSQVGAGSTFTVVLPKRPAVS